MSTMLEAREANLRFQAAISDPRSEKAAADIGSRFIRERQREEGFMRKFLPPEEVSDSELSIVTWTDKPIVVGNFEAGSPAAISVSYGGTPNEVFIQPRRYQVTGTLILSPRVAVFKQQLRTYDFDVRKVWADNIVKDTLTEEDANGISTINAILLGADVNMYGTGVPQWRTIGGGITRNSVVEGAKILVNTDFAIQTESALCTVATLMDVMKWGRDEAGGDLAESMIRGNGWVNLKLVGLNWYGTIKRWIVPNNSIYYFGAPKTLGTSILFDPTQMFVEQRIHRYTFFTSHEIGTVFVNTASLGRADF